MNPVMDWTLEFHGSEVQSTEVRDGHLRLRFSAALVQQGLGRAKEAGHVKGLELVFSQVTLMAGDLALCMGALSDSTLTFQGKHHRHIPVPFTHSGDVRAEFSFGHGNSLTLSATSVRCQAPSGAHFQASYAC